MNILAGAGGTDAQDWAQMLKRMYERYCQQHGWQATLIEQSLGEEAGIKHATLKIEGRNAYGWLKGETGVHRLVRISPFSAQRLRHTSFALVEVIPLIPDPRIEVDHKDLRIESFRASGPGGQYVNRRETAVRITHIPTGIAVASQQERSQARNREEAMRLLKIKLEYLVQQQKKQRDQALKQKVSPSWGNQTRTYVLHPYSQIRDHNTGLELSSVQSVLDGDLDNLIKAHLRQRISSCN